MQHFEVELLVLFTFFIQVIIQKRTYSKKRKRKYVCVFTRIYIFNHSENVDESEKLIT